MKTDEQPSAETNWSKESCGNGGAVESLENQPQVFHPSHRPLEILANSREIPTFPQLRRRILSNF